MNDMTKIVALNNELNDYQYGLSRDNQKIKKQNTTSEDYDKHYRVATPAQFVKQNGGICWDFATYEASVFKKQFPNIKFKTYYIVFDAAPYYPTHTFLVFEKDMKFYYFESSFKRVQGIWVADSISDIFNFVLHSMDQYRPKDYKASLLKYKYAIFEYNALHPDIPGSTTVEFMNLMEEIGQEIPHVYHSKYDVKPYIDTDDLTVRKTKTKNENDSVSSEAVKLDFYLNKEHIAEASISAVDTDKGFLYDLEVFKKYRGQGNGTKVMQYILSHYKVSDLSVDADNTPAIKLYTKFGFKRKKSFYDKTQKKTFDWYQREPVLLTENSSKSRVYTKLLYRVTYNDIGIYEAYKKACSFDEWRSFINSDAATWLDVPKIYNKDINHTSYFTKRGYELFQKNTYPIIIQKLNKRNIKVDQVVLDVKPVYEDLYQVVVPNSVNESIHKSTVDSNHKQHGQMNLNSLTRIDITEKWRKEHTAKYPYLKHIASSNDEIDVSAWLDDDKLVAIISVDRIPSKRDKIWIHDIHIDDKYRGYGLSKQLLNYAISNYKANALAVKIDNKLAQKVYQDIGFTFGTGSDDIMGNSRIMYLNNGTVYHGSPLKLNVLKPQNRSLEARDYVFASPDRNFALCYAGNAWNDFMINQSYLNDKLTLIEIEPDAFEKAFNTPGYLYALDGNDFPIRRSSCEVMTDRPVKPKSIKRIPNVYNEIKHSGIRLYHYGTWPKDHIFKSKEEYLADRTEKFKHYIQESYQFELVNKTLRFMDPINESVNKTEKLYPVYIMLVHSGTAVSNVIKKVSHSEYSHASISFDSSMSKMYSFARKDPKNPFIGGFRYESIGKGFYEKKEVPYGVYVVPCTEDQIKRMKKRLAYFEKNQEKFTFDFVGLVTNYAGIVNNPAYSWFCSRFVADILNAGSPEGKVYVPEPSLQDPDDFKRAVFARYVVSGDNLMKYDQKEVDRATKRILRAEEMYREQLNESVHYNRFDPTDPYAVTVMRYQLSNMNEAVMDEFLRYIKSFHVELDPNGNVILTRRVYNQLDHHVIQTKQALKTMKKAGDLEGMKENLAKLYYMIQLITDQYMDKKTVSISKTVKKDMIDLRSVMLNVFQQNLQYVEEMDPKFNFQSYYDGSVYGKKTKIPISGITSIGKTLGTLL